VVCWTSPGEVAPMHGGTSPGAAKGSNNALKHRRYTATALARRRYIAELIRAARGVV
jgi:hypothetical protein